MKKFTLLLLTCLFSLAGMAQLQPGKAVVSSKSLRPAMQSVSQATAFTQRRSMVQSLPAGVERMRVAKPNFNFPGAVSKHAAPALKSQEPARAASSYPIITEQPAGEEKVYQRSGGTFYYSDQSKATLQDTQDGMQVSIVFAEGKKVYIKDPISSCIAGSWVEGTLSNDGKTITTLLNQNLIYFEEQDVALATAFLTREEGASNDDFVVNSKKNKVTYTIDGNTIRLNGTDINNVYGVVYKADKNGKYASYNDYFYGSADFESVYSIFDEQVVTPPASMEAEEYVLTGTDSETQKVKKNILVGRVGTDFYIQGMCSYLPEAWVKGSLEGDQVIFPSGQYFGSFSGFTLYFGAYGTKTEMTDVIFSYDEAKDMFICTQNILISGKKVEPYIIDYLSNAVISKTGESTVDISVITDQPEGELKTYSREGSAAGNTNERGFYVVSQQGTTVDVVYAEDGKTVYIKNPVSQHEAGTWMEGTLSADGTLLTVPLGQCMAYSAALGYGTKTAMVRIKLVNDTIRAEVLDAEEAVYAIDGDMIMLLGTTGPAVSNGDGSQDVDLNGVTGLGLVYTDDDSFAGFLDWNSIYTLFSDKPTVIPEGLKTEDFALVYGGQEGLQGNILKVGFDGNDVYIQGMSSEFLPEAWVKGTLNGNKLTIPAQYAGEYSDQILFFVGATQEYKHFTAEEYGFDSWEYDYELTEDGNLVLDYDAANRSFKSEGSLLLNTNKAYVYYAEAVTLPFIEPYVERATKPAQPKVEGFDDQLERSGFCALYLNIPPLDVDGHLINPEKLSYIVYVDDNKPYVFSADEYDSILEDQTEIAYTFSDDVDFYAAGAGIALYHNDFKRIGVQSINRSLGKEVRSDISYYVIGSADGITDATNSDARIVGTVWTDLQGRKVSAPVRGGIYVKTLTTADGRTRSVKVLK